MDCSGQGSCDACGICNCDPVSWYQLLLFLLMSITIFANRPVNCTELCMYNCALVMHKQIHTHTHTHEHRDFLEQHVNVN